MTTSFPPISYPSKPVPPFTAEPPRNQFPGFFPDMWKNIKGKPYITVSSKGLANGLSEYFNDGADFGPDSLQADGSLTQTSGIQEAVNYIYNSGTTTSGNGGKSLLVGSIYLDGDVFNIDAPITIPAAPSGTYGPNLTIKGRGLQNTILNFNFDSKWGITISSDNSYGMFSFEGFSPDSGSGDTPPIH